MSQGTTCLEINICAYLKNQRHQRAISANY